MGLQSKLQTLKKSYLKHMQKKEFMSVEEVESGDCNVKLYSLPRIFLVSKNNVMDEMLFSYCNDVALFAYYNFIFYGYDLVEDQLVEIEVSKDEMLDKIPLETMIKFNQFNF